MLLSWRIIAALALIAVISIDGFCKFAGAGSWSERRVNNGCNYTIYFEDCTAREDHPDARCRAGTKITDIDCDFEPACILNCPGFVSYCQPNIATGSVPELPNGIDDDCDYYVDDEQCDNVDNDGDGFVDEDLGSCLMRVLFVPVSWQGTQAEFEATATGQFLRFIDELDLQGCLDNFGLQFLSVATDNLSAPNCTLNCGAGNLRQAFINTHPNINLNDYDLVAAFTDSNLCGNVVGCSNGWDFIWLETDYRIVFSHETGHILDLGDEYCSRDAGSTCPNCNAGSPPPPKFLGSDLGCDPRQDEGCCEDCSGNVGGCADDYKICCEGNENWTGGRCIMSYANADGPRHFCDRCFEHLTEPPNARSVANPTGQVPMDCSFTHLGHQRILNLNASLTEEGQLSVSNATLGLGRLGLGTAGTSGRYAIEIRDSLGTLHYRHVFNPKFSPGPKVSGIDYSFSRYEEVSLGLRAAIPIEVSSLKVTVLKDDVITSQTCLVANEGSPSNGTILLVVDSTPPEITAPADVTVECASPAGTSVDIGTATASDDCDSSPSVTNDAPALFPLGSTTVTWTATDAAGNESTATQIVSVIDTTLPEITMSLQKTSLWPSKHKMVDVGFSYEVFDTCDQDPVVFIQVTSDESTATAPGAGGSEHAPDAEITEDGTVYLRAERSGEGDGRVYVIEVRGDDASGNSNSSSLPVKVDYDKDNPAIDSGQNYDATEIN